MIIPRSAAARKRHARPDTVTLARSTDRASGRAHAARLHFALAGNLGPHANRFHLRFDPCDLLQQYCDDCPMSIVEHGTCAHCNIRHHDKNHAGAIGLQKPGVLKNIHYHGIYWLTISPITVPGA
ncbi:hypothetical protein [Burkholderia sp. JKS000303]|uniref:hypothetical protein n=1 Tax=Burkholderia sp. JKS000303 TaxID=1938747 RepID=UPI0015CF236E|nr:hypothetical protein [Burkholderia sp. JKS000303]